MSKSIWVLRAPDGRVVGAAAEGDWLYLGAYRAASDALVAVPSSEIHAAAHKLQHAVHADPTATRYEAAGYVLALGEVASV